MIEMEPINLVTGLPGAGKTLFAIHLATKCKTEGLRVYNLNVNGLDPEIAEPWAGPIENWQDLPEKSVLLVDEAHGVFPRQPSNAKIAPHIQALAEIRHKGLRLILVDQDPSTLDVFVKRRVGSHYHLTNRTGYDSARVYSNRGCVDNPRSSGAWSVGESDMWKYPKDLFGKYKSASLHIKRRRIPRMVWVLAAGIAFVVGGLWWTASSFTFGVDHDDIAALDQTGEGSASLTSAGASDIAGNIFGPAAQGFGTAEQWANAHTPLVAGIPWSAPIWHDQLKTSVPDMHCVMIETTCKCYTEQITPLDVERSICKAAALHGVYNPYRPRSMPSQSVAYGQQHPHTATGSGAVAVATAAPVPDAGVAHLSQAQPTIQDQMSARLSRYAPTQPPVSPYTGIR
jgi:zona occludens toxin